MAQISQIRRSADTLLGLGGAAAAFSAPPGWQLRRADPPPGHPQHRTEALTRITGVAAEHEGRSYPSLMSISKPDEAFAQSTLEKIYGFLRMRCRPARRRPTGPSDRTLLALQVRQQCPTGCGRTVRWCWRGGRRRCAGRVR